MKKQFSIRGYLNKNKIQTGLHESAPNKGDVVKLKFANMDWNVEYGDATHVHMSLPKQRMKGDWYHIGQLKDKPYYDDLMKWMKTGKQSFRKDYSW